MTAVTRLRTIRQLIRELDNAIAEVARVSGKRKTGLEIITHVLGEQLKDINSNRMLDIEVEIKS